MMALIKTDPSLHMPMYFFPSSLSSMPAIPPAMVHSQAAGRPCCHRQVSLVHKLRGTDGLPSPAGQPGVLATMAYDRHVPPTYAPKCMCETGHSCLCFGHCQCNRADSQYVLVFLLCPQPCQSLLLWHPSCAAVGLCRPGPSQENLLGLLCPGYCHYISWHYFLYLHSGHCSENELYKRAAEITVHICLTLDGHHAVLWHSLFHVHQA